MKERVHTMKRNLLFSLGVIMLVTVSLAALGGPPNDGGSFGGLLSPDRLETEHNHSIERKDRVNPVIPPRRVLSRILELNEEQMDEVDALAEQFVATVGPVREELRILSADLREEVASEDPDPCLLGESFLEVENLKAEIVETGGFFADEFSSILNPEQLEKWEIFKDRFSHRGQNRPGTDGEN